jgi:hypothetical protein
MHVRKNLLLQKKVNKTARASTCQQISKDYSTTAGMVAEYLPAPAAKPKPTPRAIPKRVWVLPPKSPVSSDRHAIELEAPKNEAAAILAGMADSETVNGEHEDFFTNLDDLALGEPEVEQQPEDEDSELQKDDDAGK